MGRGRYDMTGMARNAPGYITSQQAYSMMAPAVQCTPMATAAPPMSYGPLYPPAQPMVTQQAPVQYQAIAPAPAPAPAPSQMVGYQMYQQPQTTVIPQIQMQPPVQMQQQQQQQQLGIIPCYFSPMAPGTINPQLLYNNVPLSLQAAYGMAAQGSGVQGGIQG